MVVAIKLWFKVDFCFTFMAYDGLICYIIFR